MISSVEYYGEKAPYTVVLCGKVRIVRHHHCGVIRGGCSDTWPDWTSNMVVSAAMTVAVVRFGKEIISRPERVAETL